MTKIVHCKKEKYDVLIDRTTKFGNPYTHIKNKKTLAKYIVNSRDEAIEKYNLYLDDCLKNGTITEEELLSLDGKILGCWCRPKKCHGDVIINKINELKEKKDT